MSFGNNKNMKSQILKKNVFFLLPIICLLIISLFDMYEAKAISPLYKSAFKRQTMWIFLSIIAFAVTYKINFRLLYKKINLFYVLGLISLILVLFIGSTVNGASSWFKLGAFSIQPSEIVKFFFIIALAKMIAKETLL